jgi:hypothetical protein
VPGAQPGRTSARWETDRPSMSRPWMDRPWMGRRCTGRLYTPRLYTPRLCIGEGEKGRSWT